MRRNLGVLVVLAATACQAQPIAPEKPLVKPLASPASPAKPKIAPTTTSNVVLAASPEPVGETAPLAVTEDVPAKPRLPAGQTALLEGTVALDAGYIINNHGGGISLRSGGAIVANHGGGIIANHGGSIIASNGSSLIADAGGLVLAVGSALTAKVKLGPDGGGSLIGKIRVDGEAGGGLTAKVKYALAQADAAPAVGKQLPVAGMSVDVIDLSTGARIDVKDTEGNPFFPIISDGNGHFAAPLPADRTGNVLVLATVPGSDDPRTRLSLLTATNRANAAGSTTVSFVAVDEDTALMSAYVRRTFAVRIREMMTEKDPETAALHLTTFWNVAPPIREAVATMVRDMRAVALAAGVDDAPVGEVQVLAERVADGILGRVDLEGIRIERSIQPAWQGPEEPAFAACVDVVGQVRAKAALKLRDDPNFFATQDYMITANAMRSAGTPEYRILKAGDFNDVIVEAFVVSLGDANEVIRRAYDSIDAITCATTGQNLAARMHAATDVLKARLGTAMMLDPLAKEEAYAKIAAFGKAHGKP